MDTVFGLPLHPLVVHGTVVVVPVAAVLVVMAALWRRARVRLVWPAFAFSVLATVLVAAAAASGDPLAERVPHSSLVTRHEQLAGLLEVWVVAMTVASFGLAYVQWRRAGNPVPDWLRLPPRLTRLATPRWAAPVAAARPVVAALIGLSLITGCGTLVQVVLVGHSGAKAAWSTSSPARLSSTPAARR